MAKITDFLDDLEKGACIRRKIWQPNFYIRYNKCTFYIQNALYTKYFLDLSDLSADDWELYQEKYNYSKLINHLCIFYNDINDRKAIGILTSISSEGLCIFCCNDKNHYTYCKPLKKSDLIFDEDFIRYKEK